MDKISSCHGNGQLSMKGKAARRKGKYKTGLGKPQLCRIYLEHVFSTVLTAIGRTALLLKPQGKSISCQAKQTDRIMAEAYVLKLWKTKLLINMQWGKELVPPQDRNEVVVWLATHSRAWRDTSTNKFRMKLLNISKQRIFTKDSSSSLHIKTIFLACQWNPNKSSTYLHMLYFNCYIVCTGVPLAFSHHRVTWEEVLFP